MAKYSDSMGRENTEEEIPSPLSPPPFSGLLSILFSKQKKKEPSRKHDIKILVDEPEESSTVTAKPHLCVHDAENDSNEEGERSCDILLEKEHITGKKGERIFPVELPLISTTEKKIKMNSKVREREQHLALPTTNPGRTLTADRPPLPPPRPISESYLRPEQVNSPTPVEIAIMHQKNKEGKPSPIPKFTILARPPPPLSVCKKNEISKTRGEEDSKIYEYFRNISITK
ncbi:hypothetical protein SK128_004108 [Halocaridina rubra]|uniref:Uncharacterized protein n=1 Tax=Halocaridina rubra TaxID=373956 RepID=A0AAN8WVC0_HALRR